MRFRLSRSRGALVLVAATLALVLPATMVGADAQLAEVPALASSQPVYEGTGAWFVELKPGRTAANFRSDARGANLKYTERFTFDRLWKGLSVEVSSDQLDELEGLRSVAALYPVLSVPAPALTPVSNPELATAIAMTGADIAQSELELSGDGVRVAVMDTGVDYDNPALGGDGTTRQDSAQFPNGRVVAGHDFVGDAYNASGSGAALVPVPDPRPDDCNGHGSHVAGIVGANGDVAGDTIVGVAPEVDFGAYRVFGCTGSTSSDIMVAAMERALADDMDILNMSIGSAFQTWPQYPTAVAADALVDAGMVVVTSIGNSGANGLLSAGAPGVGNKVIGTASFDNTHVETNVLTISPDDRQVGFVPATGSPPPPPSGLLPMSRTGTVASTADACGNPANPPLGDLTGQAVLIRRGGCNFSQKASNAQKAGAAAVVLYNNVPGFFSATVVPSVAGDVPITIPVAAINDADGALIDSRLATGPVTLTWTEETLTQVTSTGGLLSSFTSYGLNAELTLKPDIGAPGGLIRSTLPLEAGGAGLNSGTSMASPHVAGAAALLKQARPGLPANEFRDVLQNSADPRPLAQAPGAGVLDFTYRQGAGMLDIDDAIRSTTTILPGGLSLGEGAGPHTRTLTLTNSGSSAVTYNVSHAGAALSGPPAASPTNFHPFGFSIFGPAGVAVSFSSPSVTVPAGGTATVNITISNGLPNLFMYGGYVVFTPTTPGQTYRVPYAGLGGDYQAAVAMPTRNLQPFGLPAGFQFPTMGQQVGPTTFNLFAPGVGGTWSLTSASQIPNVLLHFQYQSRRIEIEVVKASNGQKVHPVFSNMHEENFLPRNSTATGFFAFPWNGTRMHDNGNGTPDHRKVVPDGQYKLVVKVLKALGDANNPAHWEMWTSPTITIDRP
jgi:subtilisin family serine protease